ncbi:MAG: hypothetical protein HYS27_14405 [Deltaproteobacteria bacterium]|nr:hypothetical protein [Deltaproteobacteria bacterium]
MRISHETSDDNGWLARDEASTDLRNIPLELSELAAEGMRASFAVVAGGLVVCSICHARSSATGVQVVEVRRLEGSSDPDAEAIVLGLRCPSCGVLGGAVLGYGPTASAEDQDVLAALNLEVGDGG